MAGFVSIADPDTGVGVVPAQAYGRGQTPVTASSTGAATALTATLPAVSGKTNYLAGFEITGGGATAASLVTVTITGTIGGTMSYVVAVPAGATSGIVPLLFDFNPNIPASATNTAITVNVPSFGAGNTAAAVVVHGFYQ